MNATDTGLESGYEEAEVAENLNDEGFAMWSEAQNDIEEALAAIGGAKKTLKEARAKQHAVKMSRQYFRVGGKGKRGLLLSPHCAS